MKILVVDDDKDIVELLSIYIKNEGYEVEKAYNGLQGWVDCFEKAELKGIVTGGGIGDANDASNHEAVMMKAYELGKAL